MTPTLNWPSIDRYLMGDAWVGSRIADHLQVLCSDIGVRWAGTNSEEKAAQYVLSQFQSLSLSSSAIETFELSTSQCKSASIRVTGRDGQECPSYGSKDDLLDVRPCLFCPSVDVEANMVDVGYGMPHELDHLGSLVNGRIALIRSEFEPFSEPRHLTIRLRDLAARGAIVAITGSFHKGRRLQHMSASDWRDGDPGAVPLPLVQTSVEDLQYLRQRATAGATVSVQVSAEFRTETSWNSFADLLGHAENESIVVAAHHDTTPDSFGANDNGAGVAVLLETARLLSGLTEAENVQPGRTIRFISFGAEEQGLQGSMSFVDRHYGPEPNPRFMLALDELATGNMKGVVLQFPEQRLLVQQQLDSMNEGLQCHVLSQLDASGDMFPFALRGIPASFLWRWRFVGRHQDTAYGHSSSDTLDKVRVRELKEYAGLLSRRLLRLSQVPSADWPNPPDVAEITQRVEQERGAVFRTM